MVNGTGAWKGRILIWTWMETSDIREKHAKYEKRNMTLELQFMLLELLDIDVFGHIVE